MKLPLSSIVIEDRQRKTTGDVQSLADSFREQGQITPILVKPDGAKWRLVAGGRRCAAANLLNWQVIEGVDRVTIDDRVILVSDLTPFQLQMIEYEENIRRKDLEWQETAMAIAKLHSLKQQEHGYAVRGSDAGAWTERRMADFTGFSNSYIHYTLAIAKELSLEPKSEIWKCEGYKDAVGFLVRRMEAAANAELERRRQRNNPPILPVVPQVDGAPGAAIRESITEESDRVVVHLHGIPKAFEDCIPGEDFSINNAKCVVTFNASDKIGANLRQLLLPINGFVVAWGSFDRTNFTMMPWPLIWHRVSGEVRKGVWPFPRNYTYGFVAALREPVDAPDARSAVISSVQDEDFTSLPSAVVDFSITPFSYDGDAIHCIGGVNPVYIAELGRVPIWYEPDPEKYAAKCALLKAFYEANIPNVDVRCNPRSS